MAYLEFLSRDVEKWMAENEAPAAPGGNAGMPPQLGAQLQAILIEIEQAQVFVAVSASIATALIANDAPDLKVHHLRSYAPAVPQVYPRVLGMLSADTSVLRLMAVPGFYARLAFAQRLSSGLGALRTGTAEAAPQHELENLEDAWRRVCTASLEAAAALRAWLATEGYERPPVVNRNAEALLLSAERGERPCVDGQGWVTVPGWAESRAAKRVGVNREVQAQYRAGRQSVLIDNASITGLGLKGLSGGIAGRLISLTLESGETLTGVIVWDRDGRTGVKLDERLAADHVLLAGAR